jgi:hypothetical protein
MKINWLQRSEVAYAIWSSSNLVDWTKSGVTMSKSDSQPGGLPNGYEQWEATLTGGGKGFLKVEAVIP